MPLLGSGSSVARCPAIADLRGASVEFGRRRSVEATGARSPLSRQRRPSRHRRSCVDECHEMGRVLTSLPEADGAHPLDGPECDDDSESVCPADLASLPGDGPS